MHLFKRPLRVGAEPSLCRWLHVATVTTPSISVSSVFNTWISRSVNDLTS